jgi:hypothetical protein
MTEDARPRALPKSVVEQINRISSHRSERVRDRLALAAQAAADLKCAERLKARECAYCFYLDTRVAGQAFTKWNCQVCGAPSQHANTAVPKLCCACADEYDLCTSCMGDQDMRHRTKVRAKPRLRKRAKKT